jgi:hypothetical protein
VNNHLREATRRASGHETGPPEPPFPPPQRSAHSWRPWLIGLALLFGVYVFLGPKVLKEEYQWSFIRGTVAGVGERAAIEQTIDVKAREASAVAGAQAAATVKPEIEKAIGAETAKVAPSVEIAASNAVTEVKKAREIAKIDIGKAEAIADIDTSKQARIAKIEADKAARTREAAAYQGCVEQARQEIFRAQQAAQATPNATQAEIDAAATIARERGKASCEQFKPQEANARAAAEAAAAAVFGPR